MNALKLLLEKGVQIPNPQSVEIDAGVDPDRISAEGVVIHSGCKIYGQNTFIAAGCVLGAEAPTTVDNCQLGPNVDLKGGYFKGAVFLEGVTCGLGSHVREGTIMEEQASIAHTVGLKQTILFPYVTLGSLINFCDCFMAGGTSRKNHSEVGSSYIHFNFTPNQDKATASLIGDVPKGVMLDQKPIFLGGQGGLIGPCRLTYGITTAAGTIVRKDELRQDRLIFGGGYKYGSMKFTPGKYSGVKRILVNNVVYIGNLLALDQWYRNVRQEFVCNRFPQPLLGGLLENTRLAIQERVDRLEFFCEQHAEAQGHPSIKDWWDEIAGYLTGTVALHENETSKGSFLEALNKTEPMSSDRHYLSVIENLTQPMRSAGRDWLQSIVDDCLATASRKIPLLKTTSRK